MQKKTKELGEQVARIHEYFKRFDWSYNYEEADRVWLTGFRGEVNNFTVFVHLTENWIFFSITPLVPAPEVEVCRQKLVAYLMRLNYIINMAKFSLDSDGDVVLSVELPIEDFTYSLFSDSLNALSYYADQHFLELLNLSADPDYIPPSLSTLVKDDGGGKGQLN